MSIKSARLLSYTALLESPEVKRRAGGSTDPRVLAKHASEALREFVNAIADPVVRVIAQAALCTEPHYEGRRVVRREEKLAEKGIDHDKFVERRNHALNLIAEALEVPDVATPAPRTGQSLVPMRERPEDFSGIPLSMATAAASLHYALISATFVASFSQQFDLIDYRPNRRFEAWDAVTRRAFESFHDFTQEYSHQLEYEGRDYLFFCFEAAVFDKLLLLLQTAREQGPTYSEAELEQFIGYPLIGSSEALYASLEHSWRAWFYGEGDGLTQTPAVVHLEPLAATAGAAVRTIAQQHPLESPVLTKARLIAHKTLAYYYDFDEFAPLFDGRSLRDHADSYFDTNSHRLVNTVLV